MPIINRLPPYLLPLFPALACTPGEEARTADREAESGSAAAVPDSAWVDVRGPTFIAFFPPVTRAQVDADPDFGTLLDDFTWHVSSARDSLEALGYAVEFRFTDTLWLRDASRSWSFAPQPDSGGLGYYLVGTDQPPMTRYRIRTDMELTGLGGEYIDRKK